MGMVQKHFLLNEEDVKVIDGVKAEMGMNNSAEALRYIIRQYSIGEKARGGVHTSILRNIEEKVDLLLDIANTDLVKRNEEIFYPVSMAESPVIGKARELRRSEIASKKQERDYRVKKMPAQR